MVLRDLDLLRIGSLQRMLGAMFAIWLLAAAPLLAAGYQCSCGDSTAETPCACGGHPPLAPAETEYYPYPAPPADGTGPDTPSADEDPLLIQPGLDATDPTSAPDPLLAASFGAGAGAMSAAPNMIGDLFGTPGGSTIVGRRFVCTGQNIDNVELYCPLEDRGFVNSDGDSFDQFGSDTNGDGTIDFLPNLVESGQVNSFDTDSPQATNGPFFGVARTFRSGSGPQGQEINTADVYEEIVIEAPTPGTGLLLGRLKIAENNSPLPRDRAFVNYSYFSNVPLFPGGVNVNRITPGFEKTFHGGQMSLAFRFPLGTTLDNDITADGITSTDKLLLGNMMLIYKALLLTGNQWALTGGIAITLPTADDINVGLANGTSLLRIRNQSVHLSPYVAYLGQPTDRFFFQAFLQAEFDTNGNPIDAQGSGGTLQSMGRINDTNYLYFDLGTGYYVFRNRFEQLITSLAPVAELHWNKSLQPTDAIRRGGVQVGNFAQNVDVLNGVIGLNMTLGTDTTVTLGYSAPLGAGDNSQFDGEARLLVNRFFGTN